MENIGDILPVLTAMPEKIRLYKDEGVIEESLSAEVATPSSVLRTAEHLAVALFRPEMAALRKSRSCLRLLEAHGFHPVLCEPISIDTLCDQIWRFQWNAATDGLLGLARRLYSIHTCLLTVMWVPTRSKIPASVRLSLFKGSADPANRSASTLRSQLGSPNKLLGLIHSPDEPLDLIRETALLARHFPAVINLLWTIEGAPVREVIQAVYHKATTWEMSIEAQSLDMNARYVRLAEMVKQNDAEPDHVEAASRMLTLIEDGSRVDWVRFTDRLQRLNVRLEAWDDIFLGGMFAAMDRGIPKAIGSPSPGSWDTRADWRLDL